MRVSTLNGGLRLFSVAPLSLSYGSIRVGIESPRRAGEGHEYVVETFAYGLLVIAVYFVAGVAYHYEYHRLRYSAECYASVVRGVGAFKVGRSCLVVFGGGDMATYGLFVAFEAVIESVAVIGESDHFV